MHKRKVLVCDDDEGVLDVIDIILEENGFEVIQVINSQEIYDIIKESKPELILLDLWMPGIDGVAITKTLKDNPETVSIPIIIMSANRDIAQKTQESGANDYLSKPFEMSDLEKIVRKHLNIDQPAAIANLHP